MTRSRPMTSRVAIAATMGALLLTTACATDPTTGERRITRAGSGALIGAGGGALLGALIGGNTGALIGAGVGSIAGAGVGSYMDQQERRLREATRGTEIEVERQGDEIKLNMPGAVTFDFNSAIVRPEMRASLEEVARVMTAYPSTVIGVYGHTDSIGSAAVNQRLSEQRAEAVAGTLQSFGVPRARMQVQGFGFTQPVASNATEAGRAQNRRVEIRIVPVTQEDLARASR